MYGSGPIGGLWPDGVVVFYGKQQVICERRDKLLCGGLLAAIDPSINVIGTILYC